VAKTNRTDWKWVEWVSDDTPLLWWELGWYRAVITIEHSSPNSWEAARMCPLNWDVSG
jgi:hypothetical protein